MQAGILLLAAGGSSRMGTPKQLLPWRGTTLVRHAALQACGVADAAVYVVTGAHAPAVLAQLDGLEISVVDHPDYRDGLGSSLAAGVGHIIRSGGRDYTHLLVQLADQPAVDTAYLRLLLHQAAGDTRIIASAYGDRAGVPAVFPARYFDALSRLGADAGAGSLLKRHAADVRLIHPPVPLFDIDTPEDYRRHEGNT